MMIYRGHLLPSSSQIDSRTIQLVCDSLRPGTLMGIAVPTLTNNVRFHLKGKLAFVAWARKIKKVNPIAAGLCEPC